jgi:hypothetical protein
MIHHNSSSHDDDLRSRLRREAIETRPPFSESLHHRIVASLEKEDVALFPRRRAKRITAVAAVLAAACVLCAIVLTHSPAQQPQQPQNVTDAYLALLAPLDDWADKAVDNLSNLTVSKAYAPHSAALEHDTQLVADTLLRRLPIDVELSNSP